MNNKIQRLTKEIQRLQKIIAYSENMLDRATVSLHQFDDKFPVDSVVKTDTYVIGNLFLLSSLEPMVRVGALHQIATKGDKRDYYDVEYIAEYDPDKNVKLAAKEALKIMKIRFRTK